MVSSESDDFPLATLAKGPANSPGRTRSVSPQLTQTTGGSQAYENVANLHQVTTGAEVVPANADSVDGAGAVNKSLMVVAQLPEADSELLDGLMQPATAPPSPEKRLTRAQSTATITLDAGSAGATPKRQARKTQTKPMDFGGRNLAAMTTESYAKNLPALVDNLIRIYDRIEEVRADAQADNSRLDDSLKRALQSIEGLDTTVSSQVATQVRTAVNSALVSRAAPTVGEPHLRALQNAHNTLVATMGSRLTELDSATQALRSGLDGLTTKLEDLSIAHSATDEEVAYLRGRVYEDGYYNSLAHLQPNPPALPPPPAPAPATITPLSSATHAAVPRAMHGNISQTFGAPPPAKRPRYENGPSSRFRNSRDGPAVPSGAGSPSTSTAGSGYAGTGAKHVRFGPHPWKEGEDIKAQFLRITAAVREPVYISQKAVGNVSLDRDGHFVHVTFKNPGEASKFVSAWARDDGSQNGTTASLVS
ncbi:hypothetical protein FOMPIDRAFT_1041970, partial [Fomitopsis schrenkii]